MRVLWWKVFLRSCYAKITIEMILDDCHLYKITQVRSKNNYLFCVEFVLGRNYLRFGLVR